MGGDEEAQGTSSSQSTRTGEAQGAAVRTGRAEGEWGPEFQERATRWRSPSRWDAPRTRKSALTIVSVMGGWASPAERMRHGS